MRDLIQSLTGGESSVSDGTEIGSGQDGNGGNGKGRGWKNR